jgi:DNA-damage-inducible protein J
MTKTATVHSRINQNIKTRAEKILMTLGIKHSEAINLFYRQIILRNGIPFKLEIPNKTTAKAIKEIETGKKLKKFDNVDQLISDLNK